jgi:Reverse transcriptase (RNA-dependent DNA polymerase)
VLKARLVLGGHRDREGKSSVHGITALKQQSVRILLAVAAISGFDIEAADVIVAYVQSVENLQRYVFVRPSCVQLDQNELVRVGKPLYGLPDSVDDWNETFHEHYLVGLLMNQSSGDFSPFFKRIAGKLVGSGSYADDQSNNSSSVTESMSCLLPLDGGALY